ncbi:MAG: cytochrome c biogenesis protein CcsA [Dehalococcoidia bacterium]|nr:cytochrome c biogenesis protein CcsA [Dehalococcoidia bacterium]
MTQLVASPESVSSPGRGFARDALLIASALLMAVTLYLVYFWVPTEQNLGISQRIFYFHVPLAWIGMVSIIVVAVASMLHLFTGRQRWDDLAYSTAELGVIYASLILVTGAIWGKPAWGVWWTWDPKLTTTLVLWFIYVAYLMIRTYGPMGSQGKRFASVIALIGAIDAPIIYMASIWWRTAHPPLNIGPAASEAEALGSSRIYIALLVSVVAFTVMYISLLAERYALRKSESDLDELHQRMA